MYGTNEHKQAVATVLAPEQLHVIRVIDKRGNAETIIFICIIQVFYQIYRKIESAHLLMKVSRITMYRLGENRVFPNFGILSLENGAAYEKFFFILQT